MKEFRQLLRKRFLYDEVGRARKILRFIAIIWWCILVLSLVTGEELWRDEKGIPEEFHIFLLSIVACTTIYWLCFAKDELVLAGDIRLITSISERHHKRLRWLANQQDTTMGDIIEQLIDVIINARLNSLKASSDVTKHHESALDLSH
jgi:hypothetical protein